MELFKDADKFYLITDLRIEMDALVNLLVANNIISQEEFDLSYERELNNSKLAEEAKQLKIMVECNKILSKGELTEEDEKYIRENLPKVSNGLKEKDIDDAIERIKKTMESNKLMKSLFRNFNNQF